MKKSKTVSIRLIPMVIAMILGIVGIVQCNKTNIQQYIGGIEQDRKGANIILDSSKTTPAALNEAINSAVSGSTIILGANIEGSETIVIPSGKTLIIDLNGYNVSSLEIINNGILTLKDSQGGATITNSVENNETLTCERINITSETTGIANNATLKLNSTDVKIEGKTAAISGEGEIEVRNNLYAIEMSESADKTYKIATLKQIAGRTDEVIVNNILYATIDDAIKSITENKEREIVLIKDVTRDNYYLNMYDQGIVIIPEGKKVIINLNGHIMEDSLSGAGDDAFILNKGTLTIKGQGKIIDKYLSSNTSWGSIHNMEGANLTIIGTENQKSLLELQLDKNINNQGKLVVENVTISPKQYSVGIYNKGGNALVENSIIIAEGNRCISNTATMTLNNMELSKTGETSGKNSVECIYNTGSLTINDTKISAKNGMGIENENGTVTINNADEYPIKSEDSIAIKNIDNSSSVVATVHIKTGRIEGRFGLATEGAALCIIGSDDGKVSRENPCIQGSAYGIYMNGSTNLQVEMYDGIIKGGTASITGSSSSGKEQDIKNLRVPNGYILDEVKTEGEFYVRSIKDNTPPTTPQLTSSRTSSTITINVQSTDVGDGIAKYEYYYKDMSSTEEFQKIESTENTCTISNLKQLNAYNVYVIVYDVVGNNATSSILSITTNQKTVTGIEVQPPNKIQYDYGEPLNLTGATVCVVYDDGSKESAVPLTESMVSGYNSSKSGKQTIMVTYNGYTTTFEVTVNVAVSIAGTIKAYPELQLTDDKQAYKTSGTEELYISLSTTGIADEEKVEVYMDKFDSLEDTSVNNEGDSPIGEIEIIDNKGQAVFSDDIQEGNYCVRICIVYKGEEYYIDKPIVVYEQVHDTTKPKITKIDKETTSNSIKVNITATDEGSGIGKYQVILKNYDGTELQNLEQETSEFEFTGLDSNTWYTLQVIVSDKSGNSISGEDSGINNYCDTYTKPCAPDITYYDGSLVDSNRWDSQTWYVRVVTNDSKTNMPITEFEYTMDNGKTWTKCSPDDAGSANAKNDVIFLPEEDGVYNIKARSVGMGGAGDTSGEYVYKRDTAEPTISKFDVTTSSNSIKVKIEASDILSGVDHYIVKLYEKGNTTPINTVTDNITEYTFNGLKSNTVYGIAIEAYDKAGKKAEEYKEVSTLQTETVSVTGVKLLPETLELKVGKTGVLTATVLPSNADNQNVTWTSSDETVATIKNGVVTAVGKGEAIITVTTEDGGYTATCKVTVTDNSSNNNNSNNNNNNGGSSSNNQSNSSNSGTISKEDGTVAGSAIPQTGISYAIIGGILIIIINGMVAYIRYKKSY